MIYPNWLYYPDDDLELFIDTVQQVSHVTGCSTTEYVSVEDGKLKTKTTKQLPQATFECTWDTNHTRDLYRYLDYLKGKEVILAFGPLDLVSYAKITEASIKWAIDAVQKATLSVRFLGEQGQFREAEDSRNVGVGMYSSDTLASGGKSIYLNLIGDSIGFQLTQSDIILPAGNYTMFARVKDSAQVTDDLLLSVADRDGTLADSVSMTATGSFKIYTNDFEITASEQGHRILFEVIKNYTTTNNIYVDFLGFVPVP